MQILIEITQDTYDKLTAKSMLISASAIGEAVDAVKKGVVIYKWHDKLIDNSNVSNENVLNIILRKIFPKTLFIWEVSPAKKTRSLYMTDEWLEMPYKAESGETE